MKKIIIIIFIILLLSAGWYFISPIFLDKEVNEETPINQQSENTQTESLYSGNFADADSFHKVKGNAMILEDNNKRYLRFENFESTNGPDLKVYLSEDLDAKSYITLGELKGNIGDQNYEIPDDVDLDKYNNVLIWCEQFSVLFGHAKIDKI